MAILGKQEVLEQSKSAFEQWGEMWIKHAEINGKLYQELGTSHQDLLHIGAGRKLLCIANGPSFEKNIHLLQKYKDTKMEIACVDKCFHRLVEHGIVPDYVFLADAGISYEKYLEPYIESTKDVALISNITANPDWSQNWKGLVFFFVNKDNIKTEEIYIPISGCREAIPASSNVGNTVVVFAIQVLGYDQINLLGYDYCWSEGENYYAFEDTEKRYWMNHMTMLDNSGRMVNTSQNLFFSARWLMDFYTMCKEQGMIMFNCQKGGMLNIPHRDLEKELKHASIRELDQNEKDHIIRKRMKQVVVKNDNEALNKAFSELNVAEVIINHIPEEVKTWLM